MAKKEKSRWFDSAGWVFWLITFAVFVAPCIYAAVKFTYPEISWPVRAGTGLVSASIGAGLFTFSVNAVLQWRIRRQRLAKRKEAKRRR